MRLAAIVDQIAMECDLENCTVGQYRRAEKRFSEWLGRPSEAKHLTRQNVNSFIEQIQSYRTNTTAGNYRRALCRIWNYLTEHHGKPAYEIRRMRRPKCEEKPVVAWTMIELSALIRSSDTLPGNLKINVPASLYFSALLNVAYDTALRPSDLFILHWTQLDTDARSITLIQHKTLKPHIVFLSDNSVKALELIRYPSREKIFPLTWGGVRKWMEKIFTLAGVYGFVRLPRKNLGTLRKSNATQTFIERGEAAAAESLGHVSGTRMVRKHYIDHRERRQYTVPNRPCLTTNDG